MSHPCLIIFSLSESPAWDIELLPGQTYIAKDEREAGSLRLIISLGDRDHLTPKQEDFLADHADVLRFEVLENCSAVALKHSLDTTVPDSPRTAQSPTEGIWPIPPMGDR